MKALRPCILLLTAVTGACGISKADHDRLISESQAAQKASFDAEMAKAQAEYDAEKKKEAAKNANLLNSKDQMIKGLEDEVEKKGGDLASVRAELGAQVTQLASTKTQLDSTQSELQLKKEKLQATTQELDQLRKLREEAEKEAAQFKALAERLKSMVDSGKLSVEMRNGRINLKLPDNVLFPSGSRRLKKQGRAALKEVAQVLKDVEGREFLIAGHTDNVPVKRGGSFKNNWELSTARAVTVVGLLTKEGVPPEQLAAAGFGEFDPIAANDTRENKAKNRRLEIVLLPNIQKVDL